MGDDGALNHFADSRSKGVAAANLSFVSEQANVFLLCRVSERDRQTEPVGEELLVGVVTAQSALVLLSLPHR